MKNVSNFAFARPSALALALAFSLVGLGPSIAHADPPNKAARDAAAEKCGMPKRGEGRPTAEQTACMTAAGFSRHKHGGHHGKKGVAAAEAAESPSASGTAE